MEEFEYLGHELSYTKRPADLAMFFCTQESFTLDHLFAKEHDTPVSFYKQVWNYIKAYTESRLERNRTEDIFRDILPKCWFGSWNKRLQIQGTVLRHGFVIIFVEWLLQWFYERGRYFELLRCMDFLCSITEIPEEVRFQLLLHHPEWGTEEVLQEMIRQEYLSLDHILELLIQKRKNTTLAVLQDLMLGIFRNKEQILHFVMIVMRQYQIVVQPTPNQLKFQMTSRRRNSEEKEILEEIRLYLRDLILTDCEIDFYEFCETNYVKHMVDRNVYFANIYKAYQHWMASEERMKEQIPHYCYFGTEDFESSALQITEEDYASISYDVALWEYIQSMTIMDSYQVFIRAFNINRFYLITFNNHITIHQYFKEVSQIYPNSICWATDHFVYYFLIYAGKKKTI